MPHDIALISTMAAALGISLIMGLLAVRLQLPPLVGYLAAGVIIGPFTPGFVGDVSLASQLSEIGIMLLMFGVGLHFSIADLMAVKRIAVPGAILQILSASAMGAALAHFWGWPLVSGLVFGLALSVASTVVLLRALESRSSVNSHEGKVAIGWLVVEDLVMVLALVLLPPIATALNTGDAMTGDALLRTAVQTLLQIGGFVAFMLIVGRKLFPAILSYVAATASRELFTLSVVSAALGIAYAASAVFGVSFALGAFFAGIVLRESHLSHRAAQETLPLRDAFSVLFFTSVGMLFDPRVLLTHPLETLAVLAIIVVGKSIAALLLVLLMRYPLPIALTVAASLAQIGEFSFILATMGLQLGLLDALARNLILAGAILSIAVNPLLFTFNDRMTALLDNNHRLQRLKNRWLDPLASIPVDTPAVNLRQQVIVIGHGSIGSRIVSALRQRKVPVVVVDPNRERIEQLRANGVQAVAGDATDPGTLVQAHIMHASTLVVALPDIVGLSRIIDTARALNPSIHILVRVHSNAEQAAVPDGDTVEFVNAQDALAGDLIARIRLKD